MKELSEITSTRPSRSEAAPDLLEQYGCGPVRFSGDNDALYERHLLFDDVVDPLAVGARERFEEFSSGDFVGALVGSLAASTLTRVLCPDDSTEVGQALRFVQEYFLVACSLADLVRHFHRRNGDWRLLPDKVAIQLNDTHPTLAVPELMRILLDDAHLGWDEAWDITQQTLAYTNHTLLPEALEKWSVTYFEQLLP